MTANVETMFYAGQTPWHGLGVALPTDCVAKDAIHHAGLDWNVTLEPLFDKDGHELPRFKATTRSSDQKVLGVVQKRYTPIQNATLFKFADALVEVGKAHFHTAGSLAGGRRVWALAKLPKTIKVLKNDVTEQFLLVMTAHDGTCPTRVIFTPIRVVCQNTMMAALKGATHAVTVRHTSTAQNRLVEAMHVMGAAQAHFDVFGQLAAHLAAKRFSAAELKAFVVALFPTPAGKDEDTLSSQTQSKRDNVIYLFDHGKGHDRIKGTAWAALNGAIEFADYAYGRKTRDAEQRAESVLYGAASILKQRAFDTIIKLAA
jgi:phage/plasmid-like protein (TIGR03299 family)